MYRSIFLDDDILFWFLYSYLVHGLSSLYLVSFALKTLPDRFDEILQVRLLSVSAQLLLRPEGVRTPPTPEPYSRMKTKTPV